MYEPYYNCCFTRYNEYDAHVRVLKLLISLLLIDNNNNNYYYYYSSTRVLEYSSTYVPVS